MLKFKLRITIGRKGDSNDFEHGRLMGPDRINLKISYDDVLGFSCTTKENIHWVTVPYLIRILV